MGDYLDSLGWIIGLTGLMVLSIGIGGILLVIDPPNDSYEVIDEED